jgi:PRC-barrel domain
MNQQFDPEQLVGSQLVDTGQQRIGKVGQVFLDDETSTPQWVTVQTGLFGTRESFVPLAGAQVVGDGDVRVPYSKDQVKDAPSVDAEAGHLSEAEEAALYRYYGLGQAEASGSTDDGGPETWTRDDQGHDTSGPTTDDAMTRSEERLRAATERVEAGRARAARKARGGGGGDRHGRRAQGADRGRRRHARARRGRRAGQVGSSVREPRPGPGREGVRALVVLRRDQLCAATTSTIHGTP